MDEEQRTKVWTKIKAIRASWQDTSKLEKELIDWENFFGSKYLKVAEEILAEKIYKQFENIGRENQPNTPETLVKIMWKGWTEGKFTIEKTGEKIQILCTKCPIADAYITVGRPDLGLVFQCSEDFHIVKGFNPEIRFSRTKTLMSGDECCNHCDSTDF